MAKLFATPSPREQRWIKRFLEQETVGGSLLLLAVVAALLCANSGLRDSYRSLLDFHFGVASLNLSVTEWASEGLLAIFFLVAGLELRREFTHGSLQTLRTALLPISAAAIGMIVPALVFVALAGAENRTSWAIPTATDLAFCLTLLAVAGRGIPSPLRAFLLTLAIADDLGAIIIIALFYSAAVTWIALLIAIVVLALYGILQRNGKCPAWLGVPLALIAWYAMYRSGIHATVAGVAIGLLTNPHAREEKPSNVENLESFFQPLSVGIALPVFAFTAIGISFNVHSLSSLSSDPLSRAIVIARVVGKPLGIVGGAWLIARYTKAELNPGISWGDVTAVGLLAGIGFSVALLVSQISLPQATYDSAASALLFGAIISALLATIALLLRGRHHRLRTTSTL
jgi:Na+:H+ antiporter, NhaA family